MQQQNKKEKKETENKTPKGNLFTDLTLQEQTYSGINSSCFEMFSVSLLFPF